MTDLSRVPSLRYWFSGRRACVVGLGKSGVAAAGLLSRLGASVSVTEKRPRRDVSRWIDALPSGARVETGNHRFLKEPWDLIVTSPGVPASLWEPSRARGVPVWGELELGYRALSLAGRWPKDVAAVTGTNGKTTTTALIGAIFRAAGRRSLTAGNIGTPLCAVADTITPDTALALEVSSYQLEAADAFRPSVGAVLNVTPDHLARHGDMETYAKAKFRLFQNLRAGGAAVLNAADPWDRRLASSVPGKVFWFSGKGKADLHQAGDRLVSRIPGADGNWALPRRLPGGHNVENALAAAGLSRLLGISSAAVGRALASFPGVEHRIEFVRELRGVRYYNDSKATNVDSTLVALKAFPQGGLHLVLGGEDKGAPYAPLLPLLRRRVKAAYLIGEAAPKIRRELSGAAEWVESGTLSRAVASAAGRARPGETVLLSPACASFDQFDNFEHRGRSFKTLVEAL